MPGISEGKGGCRRYSIERDGEHKTCAVWVYDKRPANGAAFVSIDTSSQEANCSSTIATMHLMLWK